MKVFPILIAFAVLVAGCSSDSPTASPDPVPQDLMAQVLDEAGKVAPPPAERSEVTEEQGPVVGNFRTVTEVHDDSNNITDITNLGLNDAVIYPGAIVRGDQIYSYVYEPISVPRAPVTLSSTLLGAPGEPSVSEVVGNPGQVSAVRQGISNMVTRALSGEATAPAQVQWDYTRVYSKSQMSLFVKADVEYGLGNVDTAFDWATGAEKTRILAKYQQIYYTVDMDRPENPADVVAAGTSEAQLRAAFPAGSHPMYVSTVKYGFMAICAIESDYSEDEMRLAMNASYSGTVDVDLGFGRTARQVMNSSRVKVIVYGGATGGIEDLNTFDGFMQIIRSSTTFTPQSQGVPLVYVFRNLQDSTLSQIALTSQYAITRQVKVRQGVRVTVDRFVCEMSADDECLANDQVDMDRFQVICNAYSRTGAGASLVQINPVNQVVFNWASPTYTEMSAGSTLTAGGSIDLLFNTEDYNPNYQRISLSAYARDYDACGGNESAWSSVLDVNGVFYGPQTVMIYSSDFTFRTEVTISAIPD